MTEKQKPFQFSIKSLFIVTTISAVILGAFIFLTQMMEQRFHAILVGNIGPVSSFDDYPQPLKDLLNESGDVEIDKSSLQVHCLCQGFDPEYVWQMSAMPGLFEYVSKRWKLSPVDGHNWNAPINRSDISGQPTPSWWLPRQKSETQFFACPQILGSEKGECFQVALDQKQEIIYVYYWLNF